jgi:outer membrane lipoprotein SlyB
VSASQIDAARGDVYGAACALRNVSDEGDAGHVVGGLALSALDVSWMSGVSVRGRGALLVASADLADDLDTSEGDDLAAALDALASALAGEG